MLSITFWLLCYELRIGCYVMHYVMVTVLSVTCWLLCYELRNGYYVINYILVAMLSISPIKCLADTNRREADHEDHAWQLSSSSLQTSYKPPTNLLLIRKQGPALAPPPQINSQKPGLIGRSIGKTTTPPRRQVDLDEPSLFHIKCIWKQQRFETATRGSTSVKFLAVQKPHAERTRHPRLDCEPTQMITNCSIRTAITIRQCKLLHLRMKKNFCNYLSVSLIFFFFIFPLDDFKWRKYPESSNWHLKTSFHREMIGAWEKVRESIQCS